MRTPPSTRTLPGPLPLLAILLLFLSIPLLPVHEARSATGVAIANDTTSYAARMLAKVSAVWNPPPAPKGNHHLQVTVLVDRLGYVVTCKPTTSSGFEAMDAAACSAIEMAGPYGTPASGYPTEINLAFWSGDPTGKPLQRRPSTREARRTERKARDTAEQARAVQQSDRAERSARKSAEAAAKATGKKLPDVAVPPPAPASKARKGAGKASAQQRRADRKPAGEPAPDLVVAVPKTQPSDSRADAATQADAPSAPAMQAAATETGKAASSAPRTTRPTTKAPALRNAGRTRTQPTGVSQEKAKADRNKAQEANPRPTARKAQQGAVVVLKEPEGSATAPPPVPETAPPSPPDDLAGRDSEERIAYVSSLQRTLRDAVAFPKGIPPGTFRTRIMLRIAADGGILRCVLTRKTGSAPLNAAILSGLRRLAKVQPPPGATEGTFTVTLTLTHPADGSSGKVR